MLVHTVVLVGRQVGVGVLDGLLLAVQRVGVGVVILLYRGADRALDPLDDCVMTQLRLWRMARHATLAQ